MKNISVTGFIHNSETLEFNIVDLENNHLYYTIGDIETLQSAMFETYRIDKVLIHTAIPLIADSLRQIGFTVNMLDFVALEPEGDEDFE